jgi:hypothetical protein
MDIEHVTCYVQNSVTVDPYMKHIQGSRLASFVNPMLPDFLLSSGRVGTGT